MRISIVVMMVALAGTARAESDPVASKLAALGKAAKCEDKASPWRPWCLAVNGWAGGKAEALPTGKVLVGLTVELEDGKDVATALSEAVSLSALAIDKDGKVKMTMVTPSNDGEKQAIAEAVFNLANLFKGRDTAAKLPKELADYISGLKGAYATTKGKQEWTWKGASAGRARKAGSTWLVVESPEKANGVWVTILTEQWAAK